MKKILLFIMLYMTLAVSAQDRLIPDTGTLKWESGDRYMNHSYPTWNRTKQLSPNMMRDSSQKMQEIIGGRVN